MPGVLQSDHRNGTQPEAGSAVPPTIKDEQEQPIQEFVVVNQELFLDINFREQSIEGESRITIYLINPDDPPDEVALDARQCDIDTARIRVNGKRVKATYRDPYETLDLPSAWDLTPSNFPVLKSRMKRLLPRRRRDLPVENREQVGCNPADGSLRVALRPEPLVPQLPSQPLQSAADSAFVPAEPGKLRVRVSNAGLQSSGNKNVASSAREPLLTAAVLSVANTTDKVNESGTLDTLPASGQPTDGLFEIVIPFRTSHIRDGLHFVGVEEGDTRFPHVYTRHSPEPGIAACIFPCLDDPGSRCFWKIHIKCPRTLGDALLQQLASQQSSNDAAAAAYTEKALSSNGNQGKQQPEKQQADAQRCQLQLTEEDKLLDMTVVCSGNLVGELIDENDETKKIMTFEITDHGAAAHHIGFAVGPFEHVDLFSAFRTDEADEKLGASALKVHGYCLPGRQEEVLNSCASLANAADEFAMTYGRYPYDSFKLCFVDDMVEETTPLFSFSLCSNRLLFPDDVVERDMEVTRKLVHSLAYQYFGAYIVPNQRTEMWLTVGIAYYMTDLFLSKLCGNNDYRFRVKTMADRLAEEDRGRPSLHDLGTFAFLGDFEMEFMALKAPLVLFILDKRLTKAAGSASASLARVISKIIGKANTSGWGDNNNEIISTESFRRVCQKTSQYPLEAFWSQWVLGSGCPWLSVKQRFNRKRLCVEISVHQTQETIAAKPRPIRHDNFWRELVERRHGAYSRKVQRLFTGPMTIRIHEANGTPYEHIVEIREDAILTGGAKFDIPYNTKYKRLKRNRRNRERATMTAANDAGGEINEEMIVFSLGDKLDTPEEMADWELIDWTEQDEKNMDQESYEWIRIDSDFEWIAKIHTNMPAWMYLSQLQQDREIVAQQDTLLYLSRIREHAMSATILTRTLYDDRYFHGLRTLAAENLARQVWKTFDGQPGGDGGDEHGTRDQEHCDYNGKNSVVFRGLNQLVRTFRHFYCYEDSTTKPNDFTDMRQYWVRCAIIDAISKVHYENTRPHEAQRFLLDLLRFNNNSQNSFSDHIYIAKLLSALAASFCPPIGSDGVGASTQRQLGGSGKREPDMALTFDDAMSDEDDFNLGAHIDRMDVDTEERQLLESALAEVERYRRMDEWTSSYQNVWTTAALEAKRKLMKAGVIPVDALEFVRYLQDGTIDLVQLKAYEALIDLGLMLHPAILRLLLTTMTTHSSPFVRDRLFKQFTSGLAAIAFGEQSGSCAAATAAATGKSHDNAVPSYSTRETSFGKGLKDTSGVVDGGEDDDEDDNGGLIIEQGDAVIKKHQEEHARRENIDAAIESLKKAVSGNRELLTAMWEAVLSPVIGCIEKRNLVDLLEVMFEGDSSLLLTVKHPTMWTVTRRSSTSCILDFKKVARPLRLTPPAVSEPEATPPDTRAAVVSLPSMAAMEVTDEGEGTAATAASVEVRIQHLAGQRKALPDAPRKSSTPKIKLQTNRLSIGGSVGGSVARASNIKVAGSPPVLIQKPLVSTSASAQGAAIRAAGTEVTMTTVQESVADSISVQPVHLRESLGVADTAPELSKQKMTGSPAGSGGGGTKTMEKPSPLAFNKRKRDSRDDGSPPRAGKLIRIVVPSSYQQKLSPLASRWLETHQASPSGTNEEIQLNKHTTEWSTSDTQPPLASVSKPAIGQPWTSTVPEPTLQQSKPLQQKASSPTQFTPSPYKDAHKDEQSKTSEKVNAVLPPEPAPSSETAAAKPNRKPLPSGAPSSSPSAPAPAPASKAIFIKFKTKPSS
ncbi:transcription initiation factor tfiid subunit tsm1 [Niveomyces insectorum RCEF 264]|uniref:Transcription initiation factor TFIID subunit 2 n=1 Tax=Niveomyces insectorum RCEF 264 TaxID=1081102 RepID=A0A167WG73_9HYPO|nr:transcription initiation factor tfiid subunit tsm1 [Niveomyces insectorum RCEF 264]